MKPQAMIVFGLLCLSTFALQGCALVQLRPVGEGGDVLRKDLPQPKRIEGDRVYSFLAPDRIPAIDRPAFVPAAEADFMAEEEAVIGVVHGGEARAYSTWHLGRHEIVNDVLEGRPVAVTW